MAKIRPTPKNEDLRGVEGEWEEVKKIIEVSEKDVEPMMIPIKIPILTKSRDRKGHGIQVRFSVPTEWKGFAGRLMSMYPEVTTPYEMDRAIYYAGLKALYAIREHLFNTGDKRHEAIRGLYAICEEMAREEEDFVLVDRVWKILKGFRDALRKEKMTYSQWRERRDKLVNNLRKSIDTPFGEEMINNMVEEMGEIDYRDRN